MSPKITTVQPGKVKRYAVLNILWVVFGIGLMLVLNLKFKINSMVALLVAALSVGMLAGMDLMSLLHTMKAGFGNTLGELAIIGVRCGHR